METGRGGGEDGARVAAVDDVSVISRTTASPPPPSSPSPGKAMTVWCLAMDSWADWEVLSGMEYYYALRRSSLL